MKTITELKIDKSFKAASLILKYLRRELTTLEKEELEIWKQESKSNRLLFENLTNPVELESQLDQFGKTNVDTAWQDVQGKLGAKKKQQKTDKDRSIWWQAAAAVLILGLATWQIWLHNFNKPVNEVTYISQYGQDIQPGTFKAELILSDGSTVNLDNKGDTSFTESGSMVQRSADGTIKYEEGKNLNRNIAWNTLRIPNAGEYIVVLEDGTKVCLNAATTLRYPVQFAGKERRVELLAGEAYFEIAKNKEKPFIVVANQMEIQALGTAFNVNRYPCADNSISATLTEGKVKVSAKDESGFLIPGEQATLRQAPLRQAQGDKIKVVKADVEQVMAWKNGLFMFNSTPITEVMQQLTRWYDVKIEYDNNFKVKKFFTGEIKRNVPVSKLLQMMELTGIARFRIANNTVVVLPYNQ